MKKSMVYEGNKRALFAAILLIAILFSASYAYYTSVGLVDIKYNMTVEPKLNITYVMTAGNHISLSINPSLLSQGGTSYLQSAVAKDYVQLDNASDTKNLTCNYEIWYKPITKYVNSATNTGGAKEFVLIGSENTGTNASFEYDLGGVSAATKVMSGKITTTASSLNVKQTWTFTLRHYNLSVNQNEQMGKSYSGQIYFKALNCA